jgi:hypothetical protein
VPTELRHITFRPVEIVCAIHEYRRRMRRPLPSGLLRAFRISNEAGSESPVYASFEISPDGSLERQMIDLKEAELAAALILFCINRKIPLPVGSSKALRRSGDGVTLVVAITPKFHDEGLPGRI